MAGAAVAPALGVMKEHFADEPSLLIQFIVSLPAFFIIVTNLVFPLLCRYFRTRTIAIAGLLLYVVSGSGAFFLQDIHSLLVARALLGVSVGLIMPLSTGLLAYYFPPEEMAGLMGLSAAMNQMGGVIATWLAGFLATYAWNYAFLVYLLGLIALVLVICYLPNEKLLSRSAKPSLKTLVKFHPSVTGMWLLMCIFFIYPTNFAISAIGAGLSPAQVTAVMVGADLLAFFVGLLFGRLMHAFRMAIKYFAPVSFLIACIALSLDNSLFALLWGSAFVGIATGVGVPYLNTIASIKGGKEAVTTVMPLISASLYLGQFLSPILIYPLAHLWFDGDVQGAYKVGILISLIFGFQVFATRHFQSLPPE